MPAKAIWRKRLEAISTVKDAGLLDWQLMESGSSNHLLKITTEVGYWMVRINRATLGISRHQEQRIMKLIEPLKIGPEVIENNPDQGYLITAFIDQPTWQLSDLKDSSLITKLKQQLEQIHGIEYEYLPSRLDYRLKKYLKKIKNIPEKATIALLDTIQKLDFLGFWQLNNTLYHSDLNPSNILGKHEPIIIDWEFAGQGHPLLDWLILEHQAQIDLSAHYPDDINPVWIEPAKRMIHAMMSLWPHESP